MDYITKTTEYPPFTPCPNSLFEADLSATAKLTYLVLLNRALLSRSNDWIDEAGRVFIIYTLEALGKALKKSPASVKRVLRELEDAKMIIRKHLGLTRPNLIYVLIEQLKNEPSDSSKMSHQGSAKTSFQRAQKRPTNDNNKSYNKENYTAHTTPDLSDLLMKGDDR